jgi:HdeA/HdeB family
LLCSLGRIGLIRHRQEHSDCKGIPFYIFLRITCKKLLLGTPILQDNFAYWLNGYYNGKRGNKVVVDMVGMKDYVNRFEQYCLMNEDVTVLKAAADVLGSGK